MRNLYAKNIDGGVSMDFNGLLSTDFDFFRKKDKMQKDEYEKGRNEVKMHFRSLCYEMQKIHHKKTNGVLEIEKDFQNFNKRSTNIFANHDPGLNRFKVCIKMNGEHLGIEAELQSNNEEDAQYIMEILKNKKSVLWGFMMSNKYMVIYGEVISKDKKNNFIKLSSLDVNAKNYDNFISFVENAVAKGKTSFKIGIGYMYPKSECVKQGKSIANTSYEAINNLRLALEKIV